MVLASTRVLATRAQRTSVEGGKQQPERCLARALAAPGETSGSATGEGWAASRSSERDWRSSDSPRSSLAPQVARSPRRSITRQRRRSMAWRSAVVDWALAAGGLRWFWGRGLAARWAESEDDSGLGCGRRRRLKRRCRLRVALSEWVVSEETSSEGVRQASSAACGESGRRGLVEAGPGGCFAEDSAAAAAAAASSSSPSSGVVVSATRFGERCQSQGGGGGVRSSSSGVSSGFSSGSMSSSRREGVARMRKSQQQRTQSKSIAEEAKKVRHQAAVMGMRSRPSAWRTLASFGAKRGRRAPATATSSRRPEKSGT
mmetsp:Transcript_2226/g.6824  ORF Transcript_2226/g.6824 Transcript_2226/m.6824 type:complete len:316 (+) Transcript_2226:405-1352(+)